MSQEKLNRGYESEDSEEDFNSVDPAGQERRDALTNDTDNLLDEIDEVLENNAEEFVNAYVQKGGQ